MNIKKRWKNIILVFCMTIAMVGNTVTAHASALPNPEETVAQVIDFVEYCQKHGLQYADDAAAKVIAIEDARAKYQAMTTVSKTAVKSSIGKGVVQGASILGYAFTSAAVLDGALTVGAYIMENLFQIDEALAMRAVSAVDNVESGGHEYYNIKTDRWQASLLSSIQNLIDKQAGEEWVINSGLAHKSVIPTEVLANMTEAQADFYNEYLTDYAIAEFWWEHTDGVSSVYSQYFIPPQADTAYLSYDGTKLYICQGNKLLDGYSRPDTDTGYVNVFVRIAMTQYDCAGPTSTKTWTLSGLKTFDYNLNGLKFYQITQQYSAPNSLGTVNPLADPITEPMPELAPVTQPKPNVDSYEVPKTDADFEEALNNDAVMDNYIDSSGTDGGDGDGSDSDSDMPKLPYVGDGELDIADGIKGALYFVRDCFSRIWTEMAETGSEAIVAVPLTLGVVAFIIGLGMKRGGK